MQKTPSRNSAISKKGPASANCSDDIPIVDGCTIGGGDARRYSNKTSRRQSVSTIFPYACLRSLHASTREVQLSCELLDMKSPQKLSGRVALVTGAGSGIGEAAARLFAAEGAKVGVLSRTTSEVKKLARDIAKAGGEAFPLTADVGDEHEMKRALAKLHRKWKRLDVIFANAGINGVWAPLAELNIEEWDETIRINLRGTFLTIKLAIPSLHLRRRVSHCDFFGKWDENV